MENTIKDFINIYYRHLQFNNRYLKCIQSEFDLNNKKHNGPRVDFLGKTTNNKYLIIECKGEAKAECIGQVLKYRTYLKKRFNAENNKILAIIIAANFHTDFFAAISPIESLNLISAYKWIKNLSIKNRKFYYVLDSVLTNEKQKIEANKKERYEEITKIEIEEYKSQRKKLIKSSMFVNNITDSEIQKLVNSVEW